MGHRLRDPASHLTGRGGEFTTYIVQLCTVYIHTTGNKVKSCGPVGRARKVWKVFPKTNIGGDVRLSIFLRALQTQAWVCEMHRGALLNFMESVNRNHEGRGWDGREEFNGDLNSGSKSRAQKFLTETYSSLESFTRTIRVVMI